MEEAQIGGQLQHPGDCADLRAGDVWPTGGRFHDEAGERAHAGGAAERGNTPRDELPRFLGIFEQVAQTVAYAQLRGVIHRDLKPSNVMVGAFGEVQVMDWGLAKVLKAGGAADEQRVVFRTARGPVIATAGAGRSRGRVACRHGAGDASVHGAGAGGRRLEQVDRRADVFGLGSILCEILTGQPAFTGRSSGEIHRKAALGDTADAVSRLANCGRFRAGQAGERVSGS